MTSAQILFSAFALLQSGSLHVRRLDFLSGQSAFLYYNAEQFHVCDGGSGVYVTPYSSGVPSCAHEAAASPVKLLSVDMASEVVRLHEGPRWCFGAQDALYVGIADEYPSGVHLNMQCVDSITSGRSVELEVAAFMRRAALDRKTDEDAVPHAVTVCSSILGALERSMSGNYFGVFVGIGARRRELEYWLDYCGVSLPVAHLWEFSAHDNDGSSGEGGEPKGNVRPFVSRCDLRRVSGMRYVPGEAASTSEGASLLCMQDFLSLLPGHALYRPSSSDSSSSGLCSSFKPRPLSSVGSLVFFTGLGGTPLSVRSSSAHNDEQAALFSRCMASLSVPDIDGVCTTLFLRPNQFLHELLSVVSAFATSDGYRSLVVRSLWRDVDSNGLSSASGSSSASSGLSAAIRGARGLARASSAVEWASAMESLWQLTEHSGAPGGSCCGPRVVCASVAPSSVRGGVVVRVCVSGGHGVRLSVSAGGSDRGGERDAVTLQQQQQR